VTIFRSRGLAHPWPAGFTRLLLARLLLASCFFVPYIVVYAQSMGIPVGTLLVIEAVFALLTVAFDLPMAHLADRLGARQVLVLGALLEASAALLLGAFPHAVVFWAVQPLFAAAQAMTMGADSALSAGLLRRAGRPAEFRPAEELYQSTRLVTTAVVLAGASALSLLALRVPFIASGVAQLGAAAILLTVPDVRSQSDSGPDRILLRTRLPGLVTAVRRSPGLPADLGALILAGTAFGVLLYLLPVYFVRAGVSAHLLGVLSAAVALAAAGATRVFSRSGGTRFMVAIAVVASAVLGLRYVVVVAAAAVLIQCVQASIVPHYQARLMDQLRDEGEATAMSTVTTARNIGFAVVAPLLGLLVAHLGAAGLGLACALLFLVAGLVMSIRSRELAVGATPGVITPGVTAPGLEKAL
jgi:predicted MFS family arabinose efflux permease